MLLQRILFAVVAAIVDVVAASDAAATLNESAGGQSSVNAVDGGLPMIIVIGYQPSLATADEIKRDKAEIVDAVVANDIGSLPDVSVSEALQRVTGVQIGRDRGEGSAVTIRGLTQVETTLNGRELFTAGSGRGLEFTDIPAELLAGIDVYKSAAAEHIEGGIGGLIDLRTYRPFDFARLRLAASARVIHGDLVDTAKGQFSLLASDRWDTAHGELGALFSLAVQDRAWREDQKITGSPVPRTDIIAGETVVAPNGSSETTSVGTRERTAAHGALQWRPTTALELYAEGSYAEFKTTQDSHQINASASSTFVPGSATLFPGSNDLQSITWTDAPVSILSFARDTVDRTTQAAFGGQWTGSDGVVLKADLSHTDSASELFFSGPFMGGTVDYFSQDLSTSVPGTSIAGTDLLDPDNLQVTGIAYRWRPFHGDLSAARVDGEWPLLNGFIERVSAGARVARRRADNAPGLIFADAAVTGISVAEMPGYFMHNPYNFFPGSSSIGTYLTGNPDFFRDAAALREAFGIDADIPEVGNPLGIWRIEEDTQAVYLKATISTDDIPLVGNLGLRVLRTSESVSGHQSVPSTGEVTPIAINHDYIDVLPSLNLRYDLGNGLYLRAAASRTMSRPDFNQLSPSLTLIRNSIDPQLNQGGAGNPELKPIRANNLDLALEKYYGGVGSVYATAFFKQVDGFVATASNTELHDGALYQVSRPYNSDSADILGLEFGYRRFFDFLPGRWSGLGMQANYSYIDSKTSRDAQGERRPLQNLSRHSYNLIGLYEYDRFSTRVAWNWRDKYLSSIANVVGIGALPVYTKDYGWLDASLSYHFDDDVTLTLEGGNLLNTVRQSYYGVETRPHSSWRNDRQIGMLVTARLR